MRMGANGPWEGAVCGNRRSKRYHHPECRAVGELIACPICAGTWISAFLVYGLEVAPRPTCGLLAIVGATGLAELLNALTEMLGWGGQAARERAGTEAMAKARR